MTDDDPLLGLAQLWLGGSLAGWLGRLWALRISICIMIIGVYESHEKQ